jgi:hypothetical protein
VCAVSGSSSVEELGGKIGKGGPGDQHGGDESEDAEDGHDGNGVAGLDDIDEVGSGVHGVLLISAQSGVEVQGFGLAQVLAEQARGDVGECRPGDQYSRDESEDTEQGDDEYEVAALDEIDHAALSFHGVLLCCS